MEVLKVLVGERRHGRTRKRQGRTGQGQGRVIVEVAGGSCEGMLARVCT